MRNGMITIVSYSYHILKTQDLSLSVAHMIIMFLEREGIA